MKLKASLFAVAAPASVIFGSALGLITTLIAPRLLTADQYVRFAILLATGQLLSTVGFEWLKQSVLRFGHATPRVAQNNSIRVRVLNGGYGFVALVMLLAAAIMAVLATVEPAAWVAVVALMYATSQGLFDGVQAWARARLQNLRFSALWVVRAVLSLLVAVATAAATGNGAFTVAAISICMHVCIVTACVRSPGSRPRLLPLKDLPSLYPYLNFGFLAALSASLTAAMQPLFRTLSGITLGAEGAAGAILAIDISYKVMTIVGLSVNVLVSQHTYRKIDTADAELTPILEKAQFALPFLLMVPVACVFYFVQPLVVVLFAPAPLQAAYMETILYACLGGLASSVRLFCVDPLFLMARRAHLALVAPICTLVFLMAGIALSSAGDLVISPSHIAAWYFISTVLGLALAVFIARHGLGVSVPWRQLMMISLATMVMGFVLVLMRPNDLPATSAAILLSSLAYLGILVVVEGPTLRRWFNRAFVS